jgi:hypothetical protein
MHAMVLVGMRRVDGKWRLLLQNWWSRMQLIEVSSKTIISSELEVIFAVIEQTRIKSVIPTLQDEQAEIGGGDISEVMPERQFLSAGIVHSSSGVSNRGATSVLVLLVRRGLCYKRQKQSSL